MDDRDIAFDADLGQVCIVDQRIREAMAAGRSNEARQLALRRASEALSDLAMTTLVGDDSEQTFRQLQVAQTLNPTGHLVLHNLVAALLTKKLLRAANLRSVQQQLLHLGPEWPWARKYSSLLYAPMFMNVEFVAGRCNLACRMCVGGGGGAAGRFEYMPPEDFRQALIAAPTVSAVTLSSGDSDPLLHPDFEKIIEIAAEQGVYLSVYTNGLPLASRKCRKIVESRTVSAFNFSIDAATPETYRAIRGEDLHRVLNKIDMLRSMKAELGVDVPSVSLSFVAMADNISELPQFVELAQRCGANRVYVEDLIGWNDSDGPNRPANDNPRCAEFVRQALDLAAQMKLRLVLPGRLRPPPRDDIAAQPANAPDAQDSPPDGAAAPSPRLKCCSWLGGVWVQKNGRFDPCCLLHDVVDMGGVQDGPALKNEKFCRVKDLLLAGMVLPECVDQRACEYVQQRLAAGVALRVATADQLGAASDLSLQVSR